MNDDELLLALVEDKMIACADNYLVTYTNFLDVRQQSAVLSYLKNRNGIKYVLYGGFEDSERRACFFLPDYIDEDDYFRRNPEACPVNLIRMNKDGFSELSHRDYLGALMGLGIRREMLGDILIDDKGCYVAALDSVARYISDNLVSVGRGSITLSLGKNFGGIKRNESFERVRCYVSSMRIDAVIASAFKLSRTAACERIRRGEVFLNGIEVVKNDLSVPFPSKLVLRGSGKVIIEDDAGITKKGRQAFVAKRYK